LAARDERQPEDSSVAPPLQRSAYLLPLRVQQRGVHRTIRFADAFGDARAGGVGWVCVAATTGHGRRLPARPALSAIAARTALTLLRSHCFAAAALPALTAHACAPSLSNSYGMTRRFAADRQNERYLCGDTWAFCNASCWRVADIGACSSPP